MYIMHITNRRGQMLMTFIVMLVIALVGLSITATLVGTSNSDLGSSFQELNYTAAPGVQSFTLSPVGQELRVDTFVITNSSGSAFPASDFNVTVDGALDFANVTNQVDMNASWIFEPVGRVDNTLTRTVLGFATIFFALVILVFIARKFN